MASLPGAHQREVGTKLGMGGEVVRREVVREDVAGALARQHGIRQARDVGLSGRGATPGAQGRGGHQRGGGSGRPRFCFLSSVGEETKAPDV